MKTTNVRLRPIADVSIPGNTVSMTKILKVDCAHILDWESFHDVFAEAFGFPDYYGRNSSAWIDCMTYLDTDCSNVRELPGETVVVELEGAQLLKERSPQLLTDILEMSAFVNFRRIEMGEPPVLCISGNIAA